MKIADVLDHARTDRLTQLSAAEFRALSAKAEEGGPVVTLLMPMERAGAETRKNPIVFKNLLREARDRVDRGDLLHGPLGETLAALESLEQPDHEFWQHQDHGLVMVIHPDGEVANYQVPYRLHAYVWVGPGPYLGPVLRLLSPPRVNVLALDLGELRLFEATPWQLRALELGDLPTSLDEAMRFDDPEKSLQFRSVSSSNRVGPGGGDAAFHGHGVTGKENELRKIRRYFEMIDDGLAGCLSGPEVPLVLLGPGSLVGHYREVNSYSRLESDGIDVNPSHLEQSELHRRIADWLEQRERSERAGDLEELEHALSKGLGSTDTAEIVKAAVDGRVAVFFADPDASCYGVVDRDEDRVELHEDRRPESDELIGFAATRAAVSGATVRLIGDGGEESLPGDAPMAAIFRY